MIGNVWWCFILYICVCVCMCVGGVWGMEKRAEKGLLARCFVCFLFVKMYWQEEWRRKKEKQENKRENYRVYLLKKPAFNQGWKRAQMIVPTFQVASQIFPSTYLSDGVRDSTLQVSWWCYLLFTDSNEERAREPSRARPFVMSSHLYLLYVYTWYTCLLPWEAGSSSFSSSSSLYQLASFESFLLSLCLVRLFPGSLLFLQPDENVVCIHTNDPWEYVCKDEHTEKHWKDPTTTTSTSTISKK